MKAKIRIGKKGMVRRIVPGLFVFLLIVCAVPPFVIAYETALKAYYKFNETSGNPADATGQTTTTGANNVTANQAGKFGTSYSFSGSQSYVATGTINTSSYTWSAWINPDTWPASNNVYAEIMGIQNYYPAFNSSNTSLEVYRTGGKLVAFYYNNLGSPNYIVPYTFNSDPPTGQWYLMTATLDTTNGAKLYWNGQLIASNASIKAPIGVAAAYTIGENPTSSVASGQRFFDGRIDDLAIWNRVLSADEITFLGSGSGNSVETFETSYASAGNTSGDWDTTSTWRAGIVPTTQEVHLDSGSAVTVSASGKTCSNLYLGDSTGESGTLNINSGGVLSVSGAVNDGTGTSTLNVNGGTLNLNGTGASTVDNFALDGGGSVTGANGATLATNSTFELKNGSISAKLAGNGALNKTTAGTVTLSGANTYTGLTTVSAGELDLNTAGANAISGNLTVNGGTAKLLRANQIADTKNLVVGSGTFDLQGFDETVAGIQQTGGTIIGSGGTLTSTSAFDMQAGSVSAILGGSVGLNKTTAGTVTLSGANTYTGNTTISQGTLALSGSGSIANSPVINVASGAVLNSSGLAGGLVLANGQTLKGNGSLVGDVTIGAGSLLSPGNSPGTLTQSGGTETWASGGTYHWQLYDATGAAGTGWDVLNLTNSAVLDITATSGAKYTILIEGLSGISPDTQGPPLNFNSADGNYSWLIVNASGGSISGFSADKFQLSTTGFGVGQVDASSFSLTSDASGVTLHYQNQSGPGGVPEPSSMIAGGLAGLALLRKKIRKLFKRF